MRILYMANNWLGWQSLLLLKSWGVELAGLVIHPPERRGYGEEIIAAADLAPERVFLADTLEDPAVLKRIAALKADMALSVLFAYVLRPAFLGLFPRESVNIHPAYLPHNRGVYANVWSIVERTPAGVTIHYIDRGLDTGDIIARRQVDVEPIDTGKSLYHKLELAALALLAETWPLIAAGQAPRLPQDKSQGSCHRARDVKKIDHIDLDKSYNARELIDILRARTFPPHAGAYFVENGRRVYVSLQLSHQPGETTEPAD
ncbi:formyl transferase domain protein [Desulfarculus baarsii DSM 2075]|uniref:Formyl transferase domain protein n=1 Tax=Desulfarculus baarsii (strain ATCC 33931 / DSM 2075 / LMG 7858 / VKM B-1802 / 2st14) TaxID=644282 RepID=E1QM79_DESB2|nr:formyltransferase family protein [Desulfarculus baarsii]ADK86122.1 formyl transferase domain protein [Desulfarculus baarsii DSM 2075]